MMMRVASDFDYDHNVYVKINCYFIKSVQAFIVDQSKEWQTLDVFINIIYFLQLIIF